MTRRSAKDMADAVARMHETWFHMFPDQEIVQTVLIEPEQGAEIMIQCPWRNSAERALIIDRLRMTMVGVQAVRYALWSEVWLTTSEIPKGETPDEAAKRHAETYEHGDIAKDPARREAVFTLVAEHGKQPVVRVQMIERAPCGKVLSLARNPEWENQYLGGVLAHLLPPRSVN